MTTCKQDMPPPGGYAPITYKRVPLKTLIGPKGKLAILAVIWGASFAYFKEVKWGITQKRLRDWSAHSALMPMILAETDRMLLKQLKRNRDLEEEIMKDVEGWEVGKWKTLPVYNSFGPDGYFRPTSLEYFMHADIDYLKKYRLVFMYN